MRLETARPLLFIAASGALALRPYGCGMTAESERGVVSAPETLVARAAANEALSWRETEIVLMGTLHE